MARQRQQQSRSKRPFIEAVREVFAGLLLLCLLPFPRCLAVPRSLSFPLNLCPCLPAQLACGIVVVVVVVDKAPQALTAYYKS